MNSLKISKQQFERMLQIEGRTVTADNTEYKVLVRPISSKTSQESIMVIYAQSDRALGKGSVFEMNGEHFLIVNRRSWDSEHFYTSTAIRCNTHWRVNGEDYYLVCGDLSSVNPSHGSRVSEVNGNISLFTSLSYMTYLDTYFYVFGGTYKCVNKFDIDGLTYYYFQRSNNIASTNYANVEINNMTTLQLSGVGSKYQLHNELKATYGTHSDHYYAADCLPSYISTNENVATVDENGLVTAVGAGSCTIVSTISAVFSRNNELHPFIKQAFDCNINVTVGSTPTPDPDPDPDPDPTPGPDPTPDPDPDPTPTPTPTGYATITYSGSAWYIGCNKTFTGHVFDDNDVEQTAQSGTWTLSWDIPYDISSYLSVDSSVDVNKYKANLLSNTPNEQATITVRWTSTSGNTASTTIPVRLM